MPTSHASGMPCVPPSSHSAWEWTVSSDSEMKSSLEDRIIFGEQLACINEYLTDLSQRRQQVTQRMQTAHAQLLATRAHSPAGWARLTEELGAATAILQTDLPAWRYWLDQYYRLLQGGRVARAVCPAGRDRPHRLG